jgi:ABC-type Fe3+-hydroxamate transport system substrate-binding protein
MRTVLLVAALASTLSACAGQQGVVPSQTSAPDLVSIQTRTVDLPADAAMREVLATMQDLGYRITEVDPDARTVSGTHKSDVFRLDLLQLAVAVRPRDARSSTVRANAVVTELSSDSRMQVDGAEFYQRNFFGPFAELTGRRVVPFAAGETAPAVPWPADERIDW